MSALFVGDIVQLNSGGTEMVVRPFTLLSPRVQRKVRAGISVGCGWSSALSPRFHEEAFAIDNLTVISRGRAQMPPHEATAVPPVGQDRVPATDNPFDHWIKDNLIFGDREDKDAPRYTPAQIYSDYSDWCQWSCLEPISFPRFGKVWASWARSNELTYHRTGQGRYWSGFVFQPETMGATL